MFFLYTCGQHVWSEINQVLFLLQLNPHLADVRTLYAPPVQGVAEEAQAAMLSSVSSVNESDHCFLPVLKQLARCFFAFSLSLKLAEHFLQQHGPSTSASCVNQPC